MKALLKPLFVLLGVFAASTVALAVFLPLYFDPNDFKEEISASVKKQTGRDLTLKGDLSLSVFPWIGVELGEAALSNAPGFGEAPFAAFKSAGVRLKLMPLLQGNIEVGRITLDGLRLNLGKNAQGGNNWDDMSAQRDPEQSSGSAEDKKESEKKEDSKFKIKSLQVQGIEMRDAELVWDDRQAGSRYELKGLDLSTGVLAAGKSVPVELNFQIKQDKSLDAEVELTAELTADTAAKKYHFKDLVLDIVATTAAVANGKQHIKLLGELTADAGTGQYRFEGLEVTAELAGDSLPSGKQAVKLAAPALAFDMNAQTLSAPDVKLSAAGTDATLSLKGEQMLGAMRLNGKLNAPSLAPRELMRQLGMEVPKTSDPNALGKASLNAQLVATKERADLTDLTAQLDDTKLNGSMNLRFGTKTAIGFNLNADALDADRYLAPAGPKAAATTVSTAPPPSAEGKVESKSGGKDFKSTEIPVDSIRNLELDGRIKVGSLKLKGLKMRDVDLLIEAHDGRLELKPLSSSLYDGALKMSGSVDARGAQPGYALKSELSALSFGPFLKDFYGDDKLSGLARVGLDLSTQGATVGAMLASLNGDLNMQFTDGALKGFNLAQMLRGAQAKLSGQPMPAAEPQKTDFSVIAISALIRNGVLSTPAFDGKSPLFRLGGNGSIDLARERIDYTALVSVVDSLTGQGGGDLGDLKGLSIPVKLTGDLYAPSYKIDFGGMLEAKAKAEIDQRLKKEQDKLKDKLGGELMKKLGGGSAGQTTGGTAATEGSTAAPAAKPKVEDQIKEQLFKGFGKKKPAPAPAEPAAAPAAEPAPAAPAPAPAAAPPPAPEPAPAAPVPAEPAPAPAPEPAPTP